MAADPYQDCRDEELILRDRLAADRTALANERTLLSYIRTALALVITGVTMLHFLTTTLALVTGWVFAAGGAVLFLVGVTRYFQVRRMIHRLRSNG